MLCEIKSSGVGGWLDQLEIRLNTASVEVEVEVKAELGNRENQEVSFTLGHLFEPTGDKTSGWVNSPTHQEVSK